jgi:hypothetical protein
MPCGHLVVERTIFNVTHEGKEDGKCAYGKCPLRRGSRNRLRSASWNRTGDIVVAGEVGKAVSHAAAWGPEPERTVARADLELG